MGEETPQATGRGRSIAVWVGIGLAVGREQGLRLAVSRWVQAVGVILGQRSVPQSPGGGRRRRHP